MLSTCRLMHLKWNISTAIAIVNCYSHSEIGLLCLTSGGKGLISAVLIIVLQGYRQSIVNIKFSVISAGFSFVPALKTRKH